MSLSLIAAMAKHRVLGCQNRLPWHMPADLAYFKKMTLGHTIIMGRKTYESVGHPLPKRRNLVISRQADYSAPGCEVFPSLTAALEVTAKDDVMILGGGTVYALALPLVDTMYLTYIKAEVEGDVFFPEWDASEWQETACESHVADKQNPFDYRFVVLERKHKNELVG